MTVVRLAAARTSERKPVREVVDALEEMLDEARKGNVSGMGIAWIHPDGEQAGWVRHGRNVLNFMFLGALSSMHATTASDVEEDLSGGGLTPAL